MAIYAPSSTVYSNGVVSISSLTGTSYEEIIQSMGSVNYIIKKIYIQTSGFNQILEILRFQKYDSNGNIQNQLLIPTVDPVQYRNSLNIKFDSNEYILDGKLSIGYDVLALETINMYFENIILGNSDLIKPIDDFDEDFLKTYGFFKEFNDKLKIEE